ncbi:OmpH family outer membrane protein [Deinococcus sp. Arct2-2]|uniref:OmpH family outer membrane protein n=1 Tax=Deinococcus sp. Arct2-2 TaxID=2568653 RepID=UPI0010A52ACD|nr:OmpH family outer membrane protein [Deinococcus sp. Arct2-2]THF70539.1 OmpH family outer membrane protein [Deinococcus sp. Arct2-2]
MKLSAKTFLSPKALAPLAIVAAFGLGTLAPHAQTTPQKIGFVDVQKLLTSHPSNTEIEAIQKKAATELDAINKQIQAIDTKGTAATAADKQTREQLVKTGQAKAAEYDKQLAPKVAVVETAVDAAIDKVAKANGFGVIMDRNVAKNSGLVVYADPAAEMTDATVKVLKP